jgi:metal-responsive CopG/Arc/MetJ family transcriptional regulator
MTNTKKQSHRGRSPAGNEAKKVVSLTLDPTLLGKIDNYASVNGLSRSAAIENAITALFAKAPSVSSVSTTTASVNSIVQPEGCLYAAPQIGQAIFY